ncbi:hypothetical protein F5Y07DRAFT_268191 [Xylaria sp. FL0933]|nr:hypothetical protein F5Y07DRAFT_268191 [Xylaria sp. FL0933]
MFPTLIRRLASRAPIAPNLRNATPPPTSAFVSSRYKPKKVWPPDFSRLSEKEQFRFERRYKRRVKLATARPRWDKFVRLAQLGSVTFVFVYSILFMDWNTENPPFQGIRSSFWSVVGALSPEKRHARQTPDLPTTTADPK